MIKRIFDVILALILVVLLSIPLMVIAVLIKLMSKGPIIFWTDRLVQIIPFLKWQNSER